MGKYIRIKKSKNLRFRLISILYLLFISLSIIQIPIGWLRVNPNIRMSLLSLESTEDKVSNIESAKNTIANVEKEFLAFAGYNEQTDELLNPENYAQTDQYFLEQKNSTQIFEALEVLVDSILALPEADLGRQNFEKLFASDLNHGLKAKTAQVWSTWKFSHVPATVVRLQMADLLLKLNLMQGDFKIDPRSKANRPELILAYNIAKLHMGDTAYFVYQGKKRPQLDLAVGTNKPQSYEWEKDTLIFVALDTGAYHLDFSLGNEARSFNFDVLPANFKSLEYQAPKPFYSGLPLKLPIRKSQEKLDFQCSCMPGEKPKVAEQILEILPKRSGWCFLKGYTPELGSLAFKDSIYINPLPAPMIQVAGLSGDKISFRRLKQNNGLDLNLMLPEQNLKGAYSIDSVNAKVYGKKGSTAISSPQRLTLSEEALDGILYIQIEKINLNGPDGVLEISDQIIINVTNHES